VTIPVDCPHCRSARGTELFEVADPLSGEGFRVRRCSECRLAFVSPRPDDAELAAYYPDDYFGSRHRVLSSLFMKLRTRALPTAKPGARVLDLGCGRGDFLRACVARGWEAVGVEQAAAPIFQQAPPPPFRLVATERLHELPDASFDAVTLWHVLEHLPDPRRTLAEARRLLRPGGRLVVEVPNFGSWQARLGPKWWFHIDVPRHLLHFERETLAAMLDAEGFVVRRWTTFSAEYDAFGLLQSLLNRWCDTPAWLFQLLIDRRAPGTRRDVVVTTLATLPLAVVSVLVSLVAPVFGRGGVLRATATSKLDSDPVVR
jgi:2-polyprenyl-3-methyl-5-hydroxy-6-metoxy-1,4-benzoquinol methylase